jgi:hypothetical protein
MQTNESNLDRIIRGILAVILIAANLTSFLTGWLSIVAWILTVILVITALDGFCLLYKLFGISTKK